MKTLENIFDIIEENGISIDKYDENGRLCGYELNTYTKGGVNEIIFLDFRDNPNDVENVDSFIQEFKTYYDSIDIDERIESNRQDKSYRSAFTLKESVKDFTKWKKKIKKMIKSFTKMDKDKIELLGEFVNDGSHYQLLDYVFSPFNTDDGFTNIEVRDFNDNLIEEIAGLEIPDENDIEAVEKFEEILIIWLKGSKLI